MTTGAQINALWRHPIKGHGREELSSITLAAGQTMPWDRRWAVTHEGAKTDGSEWAPCANFSRGAKVPALMAISSVSDETAGTVTLSHPDRPDLTFDPDTDARAFLDWVRPLMPEDRAQSTGLVRAPDRGMTDTDFPSISLINMASNADLAMHLGESLSPLRWRGNILFEGALPWDEEKWIGQTLAIGDARLQVREPIVRCLATAANPDTGERDRDTLGGLDRLRGRQEFGIYAEVTQGGTISVGDRIELA
ncbi:MOSC domain-containing protein [Roseovarius sp. SCSIO 43702]|uniref:MOSC domain-containing protein n=1 Tax=Roseovarius sp. SCSIO 43702 TaxID=2823043 RepID=UPI001C72A249|nr:MOSC domain-containing protein [Roseovarius sp. SCSIO 43702]QYX56725.1 MOSC domain-containing protein [Roseovarius sp. SCSIO 43702]